MSDRALQAAGRLQAENDRMKALVRELIDVANEFPLLIRPAVTAYGRQIQEWQPKLQQALAKARKELES